MRITMMAAALAASMVLPAAAQSVKHIQTNESGIASAVWVGDMLYVSGQLPTPITPADRAKGTAAVYGNTQQQAESIFRKIATLLKDQGLGLGDVVMMRVYMTSDPAMDNKLDFAGMNAAYARFFGTAEQPNKPARSTVQVAALVSAGALLEIEVQAARSGPPQTAFAPDKAAAGRVVYAQNCAACHMPDLSGNGDAPALAGASFASAWSARGATALFDYMSAAMPPGGHPLSAEAYASITEFIMRANHAEPQR
jgi:enamine deaminase RidA (YjgF/YER057c/UK114 family)